MFNKSFSTVFMHKKSVSLSRMIISYFTIKSTLFLLKFIIIIFFSIFLFGNKYIIYNREIQTVVCEQMA